MTSAERFSPVLGVIALLPVEARDGPISTMSPSSDAAGEAECAVCWLSSDQRPPGWMVTWSTSAGIVARISCTNLKGKH